MKMDLEQFDGFTHGPWAWGAYSEEMDEYDTHRYVRAANGEHIIDDGSAGGEYGEVIDKDSPNGKLIAAAPGILAYAKQLERQLGVAVEALKAILEDHDERTRLHKPHESQPHKLLVMHNGNEALAKIREEQESE